MSTQRPPPPPPPNHPNAPTAGLKPFQPALEAQLEAAATAATIDVLEIVYNNGGDPVYERQIMLMVQNEGKTREEVASIVENDGVLRGLSERGVEARPGF